MKTRFLKGIFPRSTNWCTSEGELKVALQKYKENKWAQNTLISKVRLQDGASPNAVPAAGGPGTQPSWWCGAPLVGLPQPYFVLTRLAPAHGHTAALGSARQACRLIVRQCCCGGGGRRKRRASPGGLLPPKQSSGRSKGAPTEEQASAASVARLGPSPPSRSRRASRGRQGGGRRHIARNAALRTRHRRRLRRQDAFSFSLRPFRKLGQWLANRGGPLRLSGPGPVRGLYVVFGLLPASVIWQWWRVKSLRKVFGSLGTSGSRVTVSGEAQRLCLCLGLL
ncbi:uncharacterized protein LOC133377106 [Rhineura floridana]|uniref:uncharacterized protein LOC133377106 n=1 Tax=Rhineura floridana TaxID=261503 RepID=UPI002AC804AA|nr:uncharacterized protein LOC133377106 [Rhineura floridana]